MSFPRYEKYKDTGVKWLGEVPEHWQVKRYKLVFRERNERSEEGLETLLSVSSYTGVTPRSDIIDEGETLMRADTLEGYKVCYPDDLVVNIMLAWNRGLAFSQLHGVVSPAYCVYDVISNDSPQFLNYLVRSNETILYYKAFSSGVIDSRLRIYPEVFGSLYCALPQGAEQEKIVELLDLETRKIDALIEKQRRLIELLKEKRQSVISHAVTKGLNPNVPMKSSDVDWIGQVPGHWAVTRLGYFAIVENGTTPSRENLEYWTNGKIPWLASGEVNQLNITEASEFITEQALAESSLRLLPEGTIVVGLVGQGKTRGMSAILRMTATINQNLAAICPGPKILSEYILYLFQAMYVSLREDGRGGNQAAINCKMLTSLQISVPTLSEQKVISAFLDKLTEETNTLESEADDVIRLLQERRSALISAAVTGKIDVRNYTPKEPA